MRVAGWHAHDVRLLMDSEREHPAAATAGFVEVWTPHRRYVARATFVQSDALQKLVVLSIICKHAHRSWVSAKGCAAHVIADVQQLVARERHPKIDEPPGG